MPQNPPFTAGTSQRGQRTLLAGLVTVLISFLFVPLSARPSDEYALKAAFLYNFATFTEWPKEAFQKADSPFVIGVLGEDPFGPVLDHLVEEKRIGTHPMEVKRYAQMEDLARCHILFVSSSERKRFPKILHRLRGQPVLTVADIPRFAESGGMIAFTSDPSIALTINPGAIQAANLTISSKLLRLAKLVSEDPAAP